MALSSRLNYDPVELKRKLKERNWYGLTLAVRSGVSTATICHMLQGKPVTDATARKVLEALGLK